MERLLYSSSPTPLKIHSKSNLFLPRLPRTESSKSIFFPLRRPAFRRLHSLSCNHETSSTKLPSLSPLPLPIDFPTGSMPKSHFSKQIANGASLQQKVSGLGTFVALSAVIVFLIHPVFAWPAFATFQTATKTGVGAKLMRTELLSSAWTGFLAGCLHTLSGPDHLAALAPLSIGRSRMESAVVGALWGCGHDAGQLIFGLLFLLLKDRLHIEIIRTWGTRVVGFTLLVIGALGIKEASEVPTPCVALENGECDVSVYQALETPAVGKKKKIGFATFATGIVHGLQPDALMMVLPALALPSRLAGAAFLIMFLFGTVVAMGSYTVFLGSCSEALKDRIPRITEKLTWISSLVAITLGLAIIVSQFLGYSLY
ncbi:chloroplast protein FOR GROWTH AND FERTILITY 1 [Euphorbia lathyris]|uniref:chloroplast protein FOR GROWTH AND FERTILITY 1 n=1 Tax=Euphorbia lathyris TaxID=212925 RepID=UPI0033135ADC